MPKTRRAPVLRLAAGQRKIPDIQLETTGDQYASYGFALAARVGGSAFGKRGGLPPKENTGESEWPGFEL